MINLIAGVVGGVVGFTLFLIHLESDEMGNIIYRVDSDGNTRFNRSGIIEYIKSPFKSKILWNPQLLYANWIVMTATFSLFFVALANIQAFDIYPSLIDSF